MSGRFFTPLFLVSVALVVYAPLVLSHRVLWSLFVIILMFGLAPLRSPLRSDRHYNVKAVEYGIADERGYYYDAAGLLNIVQGEEMPRHMWARDGWSQRAAGKGLFHRANVGYFGFYAGPESHIIDIFALADPLLARLPNSKTHMDFYTGKNWRIGHFARDIPAGYVETLMSGDNVIVDSDLAAYYGSLRLITRGPLLSWERLLTIVRFNLGDYESYREAYLMTLH